MNQIVEDILEKNNLEVSLKSGSVTKMPFENRFFDCVIAISALEFVDDIDAACVEIARVLKPSGNFIVITPGFSQLVDIGLRVLTGESAKTDYASRRQELGSILLKRFEVIEHRTIPSWGGNLATLYRIYKFKHHG